MTVFNVVCAFCKIDMYRKPSLIAKSKSGLFFCSSEHQALASRRESGILKIGPVRDSDSRYNVSSCLSCNKVRRSVLLVDGYCKSCDYIKRWLQGDESGSTVLGEISDLIRNYLLGLRGQICWECSWGEVNLTTGKVPVQIDHIDGNSSNNVFSNLRVLCPNCHSLTATYGNNGGRAGKSARVKRYKARY